MSRLEPERELAFLSELWTLCRRHKVAIGSMSLMDGVCVRPAETDEEARDLGRELFGELFGDEPWRLRNLVTPLAEDSAIIDEPPTPAPEDSRQ